jgi:hypothetical protein
MVGEAGGGDKRSGTQAGTPGTPTTSDPLTFSNHAPVHSSSLFESTVWAAASFSPSRASLAPTVEELFLFIFFSLYALNDSIAKDDKKMKQ